MTIKRRSLDDFIEDYEKMTRLSSFKSFSLSTVYFYFYFDLFEKKQKTCILGNDHNAKSQIV